MVRTISKEDLVQLESGPSVTKLQNDAMVKTGLQTFENLNPTESEEFLSRKRDDPKRKSKQMLWGQQTVTNVLKNVWGHKNKTKRDKYLSIGNSPSVELSQHLLSDPSVSRSINGDPSLQSNTSFNSCGPVNFLSDVGSPSANEQQRKLDEEYFRQQLEARLRDLHTHRPSNADEMKKAVSFAGVPEFEKMSIPSTISVTSDGSNKTYEDCSDGHDFSRQNSLDSSTSGGSEESGYSTTYVPSFGFRNLLYGDSSMSNATTIPPFHWKQQDGLDKPLLTFDEPMAEQSLLVTPKSFEDVEEENYDRRSVYLCGCLWCCLIAGFACIAILFIKMYYLEQYHQVDTKMDPTLSIACDDDYVLCEGDLVPVTDAIAAANINIHGLADDVTDLNDRVTHANTQVTQVQHETDDLSTSVTSVNDQVTRLNGDMTQVEDEVEDLETNIENLSQTVDSVQNGLLDVHGELNEHDATLSTHGDELTDLTNRLMTLESSSTDSSAGVAAVDAKLDSELADLQAQLLATQTDLEDTQANLGAVKATVDSNVNQIEDNKERLTKLENSVTEMNTDTTNDDGTGINGGASTAADSGVETSDVWKNHKSTVTCPQNSTPVSCWISIDYFTRYNLQSELDAETRSCECSCYPKDDDYSCNGALCQARCVTF